MTRQKRVPVSVSTTSVIENGEVVYLTNVICNDGTIWELTSCEEGWKQLPSIPQDSETSNTKKIQICDGECTKRDNHSCQEGKNLVELFDQVCQDVFGVKYINGECVKI